MEQKRPCGLHCIRINHIGVTAGGQEILRDVNLHCHCGELTVIIGRNGAGKSTLIKTILNEIPHTGSIVFRDHENGAIQNMRIGYVPQSLAIDRNSPASVYDLFSSLVSRRPVFLFQSKGLKQKLVDQLSLFQAGHLIDQRVGSLSGGELQRVMLAVATYQNPNLLVLDEPASGIDQKGLKGFYEMLADLKNRYDMAVILVSHDLEFVRRYADSVVLLDKSILCKGTPSEVFESTAFREIFGAAIPESRATGKGG